MLFGTLYCKGVCNYYEGDEGRSAYTSRSHVAICTDTNICVKEGEGNTWIDSTFRPNICTGDSNCEGELDWCREEGRKEEKCPEGFTRCLRIGSNKAGGHGTKSIPGQCMEDSKWRDGKENNCLDRSDEDPFQETASSTNKETIIDFGSLKNCKDKYGDPGLECGGQESSNCIPMDDWCSEYSIECPVLGIWTNNPVLCANNYFWSKQSCGTLGPFNLIRCRAGNIGRCMFPPNWGVEGEGCPDGSDKYRPIKEPAEAEDPDRQASPEAGSNDQSSNGKQSNSDEDVGKEKVKTSEVHGSLHFQPQVWKTESWTDEDYNRKYEGKEEGAKYTKDSTTGLWMVPVSEKTCKASKGFVCKVSLYAINHKL